MIELTSLTKIIIFLFLTYIIVKTGFYKSFFNFVSNLIGRVWSLGNKGTNLSVDNSKRKNYVRKKLKNIKYGGEI